MSAGDWVFGYGSLVADHRPRPEHPEGPRWARLGGHRRTWDVAMANADPVNDPKHYVEAATGERPDIHVAYLNVRSSPRDDCIGALIPVDESGLAAIDVREVNYRRIEVGAAVEPRPPGRIWLYVGLDAARERFRRGSEAGTAFVAADYVAAVRRGFRAEPWTYREFVGSTDRVSVPSRDLTVVRRTH